MKRDSSGWRRLLALKRERVDEAKTEMIRKN